MAISWNLLRKREHGDKGLALGFGIPLGVMPANVLPGWAVAVTPDAPASVSFDDVQAARKLAGAYLPGIPLILFGLGAGGATVRALLLSHVTPPPWAVLLAGDVPAAGGWELPLVWEPLMERAKGGQGMVSLATAEGSEWSGVLEGLGSYQGAAVSLVVTPKGGTEKTPAEYLALLSQFADGPSAKKT